LVKSERSLFENTVIINTGSSAPLKKVIVLNPPLLPFPRPANLSFGIHIKLDADVVAFFKRQGAGYQTRINAALKAYVRHAEQKGA